MHLHKNDPPDNIIMGLGIDLSTNIDHFDMQIYAKRDKHCASNCGYTMYGRVTFMIGSDYLSSVKWN